MWCCSRKTLFILLAVAGLIGLLMATGKVNAYAILPFLPILACPLMCVAMMMFGRKCRDGERDPKGKSHSASKKPHVEA